MTQFKGFDDWIEIFKGGKQTDSSGREHDGDELIEKAVSTFDAGHHEPPLVVGHPKDNSPAFGWVEGLKTAVKDGKKVLLAKFKQVVPAFVELAEQGVYKKRSASFYPDGRLRHVGFLGGAAPAVKGLADVEFSDDGEDVFEFYSSVAVVETASGIFRRLREWFIEKEGKEKADEIIPDWDVNIIRDFKPEQGRGPGVEPVYTEQKEDVTMTFKEFMEVFKFWKQVEENPNVEIPPMPGIQNTQHQPKPVGFTEADMETARKLAAEEAAMAERKKIEAEFAEKNLLAQREQRGREIDRWYDDSLKAGKVIPAWEKAGLRAFMQSLDGDEALSFAEGTEKVSRLEWFKSFMNGLPKVVNFGELATRDNDVSGNAGAKLSAIIQKKMGDKSISYSAAFVEAQLENPDLAREYAQDLN